MVSAMFQNEKAGEKNWSNPVQANNLEYNYTGLHSWIGKIENKSHQQN